MRRTTPRGDIAIDQDRLDFLRGLAAFYVVLNHTRGSLWMGGKALLAAAPTAVNYITVFVLQLTSLGTEFVTLFFVLSGFAMRHSISQSTSTSLFYLKRFLRIWPPYVAAIVFALLCERATGGAEISRKFWPMLFYIDTSTAFTPQFWSLPYEIIFYLLCPFVLANRQRLRWLGLAAVVASAITLAWKGPMLNPYHLLAADFIGNELFLFACGALCYDYIHIIPKLSPAITLLFSIILLSVAFIVKTVIGDSNMMSNSVMIVFTVLLIRNLPRRLASIRWINLGFFSYSIYIFHFAVVAVIAAALRRSGFEPHAIRNPFVWIAAVPIILLVCLILYCASERLSNQMVARLRAAPR